MKVLAGIFLGVLLVILTAFLLAATGSFNVSAKEGVGKFEQKVATFTLDKKLKPGKYSVRGLWGGNDACEYDFEVKKK